MTVHAKGPRAVLTVLVLALARPAGGEEVRTTTSLARLGLTDAVRREATRATLSLPFAARGDEVLVGARLSLRLDRSAAPDTGITGLEVRINDVPVHVIEAERFGAGDGRHDILVDPTLVVERNTLTLALLGSAGMVCAGDVPAGTWRLVAGGTLERRGRPLPLPDDLAILPLPFHDPHADPVATVPVALLVDPGPRALRAAGLVAAWFAMGTPRPARFPTRLGSLPETGAVVLATDDTAAAALGLRPTGVPTVRMIDHPRHPGTNRKLLVLTGPDPAGLEAAARAVAHEARPLEGPAVTLPSLLPPPPRAPYDAPRWVPAGQDVRLGDLVAPEGLVHHGRTRGTIRFTFRLAPDLFAWPEEFVDLELGYRWRVPPDVPPPTLTVELNGHFAAALEPDDEPDPDGWRTARVRLHRTHLHGFNDLRIHAEYPGAAAVCEGGDDPDVEVAVSPDSRLRVGDLAHFARLPDLTRFVYDGYPFTRRADLAETALVLPDEPRPEEVATALSLLGHFAAVTGVPADHVAIRRSGEVLDDPGMAGRDLLLVGALDRHALLHRWRDGLPLRWRSSTRRPEIRPASPADIAWTALEGRLTGGERRRATAFLAAVDGPLVAVMGARSPLAADRSLVAVTATPSEGMPAIHTLQRPAEDGPPSGDLLLAAGERRAFFRLAPRYDVGRLDAWTHARWFLANHWLALFPCLALGAGGLVHILGGGLRRRRAARLADPAEDPS